MVTWSGSIVRGALKELEAILGAQRKASKFWVSRVQSFSRLCPTKTRLKRHSSPDTTLKKSQHPYIRHNHPFDTKQSIHDSENNRNRNDEGMNNRHSRNTTNKDNNVVIVAVIVIVSTIILIFGIIQVVLFKTTKVVAILAQAVKCAVFPAFPNRAQLLQPSFTPALKPPPNTRPK